MFPVPLRRIPVRSVVPEEQFIRRIKNMSNVKRQLEISQPSRDPSRLSGGNQDCVQILDVKARFRACSVVSGDMQRRGMLGVTMRLDHDFNILIERDEKMQEALDGKLPKSAAQHLGEAAS